MKRPWWKEAVVYQIYPRSFMDASGDGIGDLQGIISKLDYLQFLGVTVLWLCPIYQSPNDDNGYDISDYRTILNEFGTMEDFEKLLAETHQRDMKIVMDLVVNHTSDEHPWFKNARSSRSAHYRDYYIWHDERNEWTSAFSGSAWTFDENTSQYYLHLFSKKQPDLNWENPNVRKEVYELMRYWLDIGIDGFRMDVINFISKSFSKSNSIEEGTSNEYFINGPRIHEYLQEMNREVLCHYDVMTVGETPCVTPEEAALFTGDMRNELNMVFQFEHMDLDSGQNGKWDIKPWKLVDLKKIMSKWQTDLYGVGWNSLYLNNHDQPRMVSRFGDDAKYHFESAKMLATFLHMMQGTPYIYQGEEIGMTNVQFSSIQDYRDVETLNMWAEKESKEGFDEQRTLSAIHSKGRDNARTPMQWTGERHAGFTAAKPWIGVNPNYQKINVAEQLNNSNSILHYYRSLISLRKKYDIIIDGEYQSILDEDENICSYVRVLGNQNLLVILNFFSGTPEFTLPKEINFGKKELLISNYNVDEESPIGRFTLRPYEARVYLLNK